MALHDRDQQQPQPDRPPAQAAGAPARLRPVHRSARRNRTATGRDGLGGPLSGRGPRPRGRPRRPRGPLRAARERRAGVRGGAPASAGQPARRPDPARGARLLRARGRRFARHHGRLGQQRPPARPQDDRRRCARAEPAGHAARARRRAAQRARRGLHGRHATG